MKQINNSVSKFEEIAINQGYKGLEKYDQPLDPFDGTHCFLSMAAEEQVDGFQYLYAEMNKRKHVSDQIRAIIKDAPPSTHEHINTLLDQLEGKYK